jgi:peptide chain release factor
MKIIHVGCKSTEFATTSVIVKIMSMVVWSGRSLALVRAWQKTRITTAFWPRLDETRQHIFHQIPSTGLCPFASLADQDDNDSIVNPSLLTQSLTMENLYTEWTLEQDQLLWEHHQDSTAELAVLLGRGFRGVRNRLAKLHDVNSQAYERLFTKQKTSRIETNGTFMETKKGKLIPAGEILRRIQWDYSLSSNDFSVLHYDRMEDSIMESPFDAPNQNIQGGDDLLVDALPEHRIVAIKYKEQVVWDREKRLDLFSSNGGIQNIVSNYDEWKRNKDAHQEWIRLRQTLAADAARSILGQDRYDKFQSISKTLRAELEDPPIGFSIKKETEDYVKAIIDLFRHAHQERTSTEVPDRSIDIEAVECLSEIVAVSDDEDYRDIVLEELSLAFRRLEGKSSTLPTSMSSINNLQLPELSEDDITETFVRGSGAGGQKVNKTSNKVVLLHNPTNLRVECQETRSLQQNRKIARKRLRIKLDEFLNGKQSRANVLATKASNKKAKAKARSRARNRKKAAMKNEDISS